MISSTPITIKILKKDFMDLTLVDLPGLWFNDIKDQNQEIDIREKIKQTYWEFIKEPKCIIVILISADQDLSTSEAVKIAEKADPKLERTVLVWTKADKSEKNFYRKVTDCDKFPQGIYVVKNRNQEEIDNGMTLEQSLKMEQEFMENNEEMKMIPSWNKGHFMLIDRLLIL